MKMKVMNASLRLLAKTYAIRSKIGRERLLQIKSDCFVINWLLDYGLAIT